MLRLLLLRRQRALHLHCAFLHTLRPTSLPSCGGARVVTAIAKAGARGWASSAFPNPLVVRLQATSVVAAPGCMHVQGALLWHPYGGGILSCGRGLGARGCKGRTDDAAAKKKEFKFSRNHTPIHHHNMHAQDFSLRFQHEALLPPGPGGGDGGAGKENAPLPCYKSCGADAHHHSPLVPPFTPLGCCRGPDPCQL